MAFTPTKRPELHAELTQVSRFETWVRKLLSVKRSGILGELDPRMSVSFDPLASMTFEERFHQGVRTYNIETSRAAVVANSGKLSIYNPLASKMLCVVEAANVRQSAAAVGTGMIYIGTTDEADAPINLAQALDNRITQLQPGFPAWLNTTSAMVQRTGDAAIIAGTNARLSDGSLVAWSDLNLMGFAPVVLPPGWKMLLIGNVNTAVRLTIKWYERVLEGSELT